MAVLFVGHVKSKADKLAQAAPLFAEYGQQAQQSLQGLDAILEERRRYEEKQKEEQDKTDLTNAFAAADMFGGPDKAPPAVRNMLATRLGFDFPRDEKGDVIIPQSSKSMFEEAKKTFFSDPENIKKYMPKLMQLEERGWDPEHVRLMGEKIAADTAIATENTRWKMYKEDRADARAAASRSAAMDRTLARIRERGGKDDAPSNYFVDPTGEEVLSKEEYNTKVPADMTIPYRQLSVRELSNWRALHKDKEDARWRKIQIQGQNLAHDTALMRMKVGVADHYIRQARLEAGLALTDPDKSKRKIHEENRDRYQKMAADTVISDLQHNPNFEHDDPATLNGMVDVHDLVKAATAHPDLLDTVGTPADASSGFEILNDTKVP